MRKAALIYNPASGRQHALRVKKVEAAAAALRDAGTDSSLMPTRAAGSGGEQAHEAIAAGHDAIFVCGGDGTVQDVLQGMAEKHADIPLGLVPLGTGNVLAYDLGIPNDPTAAIRTQLGFLPRKIAAGRVDYRLKKDGSEQRRYFTVMAGVGADAEMIYRVSAESKSRFGQWAYNFEMFRLAFLHPPDQIIENVGQGVLGLGREQVRNRRINPLDGGQRCIKKNPSSISPNLLGIAIARKVNEMLHQGLKRRETGNEPDRAFRYGHDCSTFRDRT